MRVAGMIVTLMAVATDSLARCFLDREVQLESVVQAAGAGRIYGYLV